MSFPTFSLLKPNILKTVPEQIKAKQQRAVNGQDFWSLPSVKGKGRNFQQRDHANFNMQKNEETKEGGLPGSLPSL